MNRSVSSSKKCKVSLLILVFLSTSLYNSEGRKCVCTSKACKEAGVDVCRTRFSCYTEEIYDIDGTSRDNSSTRGCTEGATPLLCETNAWTRSSRRGSTLINAVGINNELSVDSTATTRHELVWPRLKCCDAHDYCNSVVDDDANKNDRLVEKSRVKSTNGSGIDAAAAVVDDENSRTRHNESMSESSVSMRKDRKEEQQQPIESPGGSGSTIQDRETGSTRTIVPGFEDRERSYDPLRHRIRPLHVAVVVLAIAALTSVLGACYVITRFLRSPFDVGSP